MSVQDQVENSPAVEKSTLGKIGPVSLSFFIHFALMTVIGGAVIIEQAVPKSSFRPAILGENFDQQVESELVPDDPVQASSGVESTEMLENPAELTEASSAPDPVEAISVASPSSSTSWNVTLAQPGKISIQGAGRGESATSGVQENVPGKNSKKVSFFGLQAEAERIGFYLDFSGSMSGPRKEALLKELGKTLKSLPDGTELMIILWAGPAWSLDENPKEVESTWKKIDSFTWEPRSLSKIKTPSYYKLDAAVRSQILSQLETVSQLPGGTDWVSPFLLASRNPKSPDLVYLMTDGQNKDSASPTAAADAKKNMARFQSEISKYVAKNQEKPPQIHIIAIGADKDNLKALESVSDTHNGKTVLIK